MFQTLVSYSLRRNEKLHKCKLHKCNFLNCTVKWARRTFVGAAYKVVHDPNKVMDALRSKYLVSPIYYEGMHRREVLELPEKALREVIYNAIAHRDYKGAPIQMRVYDDSVQVWNEGPLPSGITPELLLGEHPSHPRNKNIANAFFRAGFIESWGRGYMRIENEMRRVGLPAPKVEEISGGVWVTLKRRPMSEIIAHGDKKWPEYTNTDDINGIKVDTNDTESGASGINDVSSSVSSLVSSGVLEKLTDRQKVIIDMINRNPYVTAKEMSVALSVVVRTIYRDLSTLQKLNIIRHEGVTSAGIWVVLE